MKRLLLSLLSLSMCFAKAQSKTDTVKVIALVCDTADMDNKFRAFYFKNPVNGNSLGVSTIKFPMCFWLYLYKVGNIEYIDENKKPLSKSIIVWQRKEL
jgi:hypothetical protein